MEIETVKKKRGYTKIDPSNYELVALAACTRDKALAKQLGLSKSHFSLFVGYAANYVTNPIIGKRDILVLIQRLLHI